MQKRFEHKKSILPLLLLMFLFLPRPACAETLDLQSIGGEAVAAVNQNLPAFSPDEFTGEDYIAYSGLDALGRPGAATACLSAASLPTEPRADSGGFVPAGWQTARYDGLIDGHYLYSRCCLISPALGGDAAEPQNVFTGTRWLRTEEMQPFEELVAAFLRRTDCRVLYRVTPLYRGKELVARGVQIEARSVEDAGRSVCFNVSLKNVQPGVRIDYLTGESKADEAVKVTATAEALIAAWQATPLSEQTAPKVGSFAALGGGTSGQTGNTKTSQQSAGTRPAWIPKNDNGIYHVNPNCGNLNIETAIKTTEEAAMKNHQKCSGDCKNY